MNAFVMKAPYIVTIFVLLCLPAGVKAQSAKENFNKAKYALEDGNTSGCLIYLERCETELRGSNVKIEALKAQCYAQTDEWVKAKIAFRNYYYMLDAADRAGETWDQMEELGREIDKGLEDQENAFRKEKEDEKKENLRQVEETIRQHETLTAEKTNKINERNEGALYRTAMTTRDPNALALYKETVGDAGGTSQVRQIEQELDKQKNPDKYLLPAVLDRNTAEAEYLISLGGNKDLKNSDGKSLLHLTVDTDDKATQEMLQQKGANLEARNSNDETTLLYALRMDRYELCRNLLDLGADPKAVKRNGVTTLHYAVTFANNADIAAMLLKKGADANKPFAYNDTTMTPLYHAVYYRKSRQLIQTLIDGGARVDEGKEGWTPLMAAIVIHQPELVSTLLKNNARVNMQGIHGWTALHFAARENQPDLVSALLKAGADKKIADEWGRTPKNVAYENDTHASLKALR